MALSIAPLPVVPYVLRMLQHLLIFRIKFGTVRINVLQGIDHLLLREIEPLPDQMWRPIRGEIIHHIIEGNTRTSDEKSARGSQ